MKKAIRKAQAEETVAIYERGTYTSANGCEVAIGEQVSSSITGTQTYDLETMPSAPAARFEGAPVIEIANETTFAAIQRLHSAGSKGIGALNFASARNPGGGFLNGAEAQEEALSRASALVATLMTQFGVFYQRNRACKSCIYLDLAIVSPDVPFFRSDDGRLLDEAVLATVITAPAPNAGAVTNNEPEKVGDIVPALHRRTELVLRAAALAQVRTLVLGAWGCGVFRNDPNDVARTFADFLRPGGSYHHHFERIVFAIFDSSPDQPKVQAFQQALAAN